MSLETLYLVSQIVGVVVIIATLLAILWQGWQTNRIARADLTLSMWMQAGAMNMSMVDTEDKAAFMRRVFDPSAKLTPQDFLRLEFIAPTIVGINEAAFNLHQRGLIEETVYARSIDGFRSFFLSPALRGWWKRHRMRQFHPEFCSIADGIISEIESAQKKVALEKDPSA